MSNKHKDAQWKEAAQRCRLSSDDLRMAKELGIGPRALLKNIPSKSQPWKLPVRDWIRELHAKRFPHKPRPPETKVTPQNVAALAQRQEDGNYRLRQYLKYQDRLSEEQLDQHVRETTDRVWATIDCTTCANCCRELSIGVTPHDAQRLAARLQLSPDDLAQRYLEPCTDPDDTEDGILWHIRGKPCPFLHANRCTVYEDRPDQCRKYPYLHESDVSFRMLAMIQRTFTCPIVLRVLEDLRQHWNIKA